MKFCPNCGAPRALPDAAFCANCGEAYPTVVAPQAPAQATPTPPTPRQTATPPAQPPQQSARELQSSIDKILNAAMSAEDVADLPDVPPADAGADLFGQQPETPPATLYEAAPAEPLFEEPAQPDITGGVAQNLFEEPGDAAPDLFAGATTGSLEDSLYAAPAQNTAYQPQQNLFEQPAGHGQGAYAQPGAELFDDEQDWFDTGDDPQPAGGYPADEPYQDPYATQGYPAQQSAGQDALFEEEAPRQSAPRQSQPRAQQPQRAANQRARAPQQEDGWQQLPGQSLQDLYDDGNEGIPLPRRERDEEEAPRRKGKKKRRGVSPVLVLIGVFVFLVGVAGATFGMLYINNNANKTINTFLTNLANGDVAALEESVVLNGVDTSDAAWAALVDGFESSLDRAALESQLRAQAEGRGTAEEAYPAIQLKSQKMFLFINKYYIEINGVEIVLQADGGASLLLNGEQKQPTEGTTYTRIMPGMYTWELWYPDGNQESGVASFYALSSTFNPLATGHTVTVDNCLSDDAVLYVDGAERAEKPIDGVVTLTNIEVGSTIRIVATVNGTQREASIVFSDPGNTTLWFDNWSEDTGAGSDNPAASLTERETNAVMEEYYRSYLGCINDQSTDGLKRSTTANKQSVAERIKLSDNANNTFEYTSALCEMDSIQRGDNTVTIIVEFKYRYTPRDGSGEWKEGSNRQEVKLVYENGEWLVDSMTYIG